MAKYTITVTCDDHDDALAVTQAVKNKLKLDGIWDEVFRPKIKYSDDQVTVDAFELVWESLRQYLSED